MNQRCEYFKDCGGCSYLDLEEFEYQKIKSQKLFENLELCGFAPDEKNFEIKWLAPKRRKAILQIDENNNLGFFAKLSKKLVKIEKCYVLEKPLSELICPLQNFITNFENNLLTQIQITLFDNVVDVVFLAKRSLNFAQNKKIFEFAQALQINASSLVENNFSVIYIWQDPFIKIQTNNLKLKLSSQIFIQATRAGLDEIIEIIRAQNFHNLKVVDIYTGFGIYSFAISDLVKEISAFEGSAQMVDLIEKNISLNELKNKIKSYKRDLFSFPISWLELKEFDVAIINPPRNGASPQVKEISLSKLKKIVYVSCNPKSFAQDAKILKNGGFVLQKITAIDQFYSTDHFELVALLERV